jgi:polyisoprenoid-binding protein YceI
MRIAYWTVFAICFTVVQGADPLTLISEKSKIEFVGKKPDGQHKGGFKSFTTEAKADWEDPSRGMLKISIDANSLWSDDEKLTSHLKNPDFFDVRKYPTIKFESTKIEHSPAEEGKATLIGKMTMLDKTVEIKVPCSVDVTDSQVTVKTNYKLDRTLWGMTYGEGKINKDVDVSAELVFKR